MEPFYGPKDTWHATSEASEDASEEESEHEALDVAAPAALPPRSWVAEARGATKGPAPTAPAA